MSNNLRGFWKEEKKPKPEKVEKAKLPKTRLSTKEKRKKKKLERKGVIRTEGQDFYYSIEWRRLRYRVLQKYSAECMCCGRSKKDHGVVIHVDHIKPKSKYPELALVFENLQLLCEDCNIGKSDVDETDWRPDDPDEVDAEMQILAEARKWI